MALALWVTGCSLHDVQPDPPPPIAFPEAWSGSLGETEVPDRWWEAFADPGLSALIDDALGGNLDIQRAWARLDQAWALSDAADAGWWPQINAEANVSRGRSYGFGGQAATSNRFSLRATATWEADIWGRVAALDSASEIDVQASRLDLSGAAMSLAGQVAGVWYELAGQRALSALLAAQIQTSRTFLELVELRFQQGIVSAVDVLQQRQQLASIESQLPLVDSRLAVLSNQLAVLTGRPPGSVLYSPPDVLPEPPPQPTAGVPADLLTRRPDVRSAQLRVVSADHRTAAAIADRLPTLRLSAYIGFESTDISDLFERWVWGIAGGLLGPVFDGGRRAAEVERTRAVTRELWLAFGQVTLTAIREVEDALAQETHQVRYIAEIARRLEIAQATLREARNRYAQGLTDYLPVLTALTTVQGLEQSAVQARAQQLAFRIQLYRALGGSWMDDLAPPEAADASLEPTGDTDADPAAEGP
jgi:NodT family efflux transporter outer membrane factor (OMF) lipoprotein